MYLEKLFFKKQRRNPLGHSLTNLFSSNESEMGKLSHLRLTLGLTFLTDFITFTVGNTFMVVIAFTGDTVIRCYKMDQPCIH